MQTQITEPQTIFAPEGLGRGRDFELVDFIGRQGVVAIEHVMAALDVGQAAAYRRVAACIDRGLLERLDLLRHEPSRISAPPAGRRYAGLGLPVAVVSPGAVDHWLRCATTAALLAAEFGAERVISERELRAAERLEGRPIASAKLGELPSGHPRLHRPDLAILPDGHPLAHPYPAAHARTREFGREIAGDAGRGRTGAEDMRVIAIEVELTPKAPRRLLSIIRAWRGADWVAEVRYYCAPGPTRRGVEAAVAKAYAAPRVQVLETVPRARSEQASPPGEAQGASQPGSSATAARRSERPSRSGSSGASEAEAFAAKPRPLDSDSSRRERSGSRCSR